MAAADVERLRQVDDRCLAARESEEGHRHAVGNLHAGGITGFRSAVDVDGRAGRYTDGGAVVRLVAGSSLGLLGNLVHQVLRDDSHRSVERVLEVGSRHRGGRRHVERAALAVAVEQLDGVGGCRSKTDEVVVSGGNCFSAQRVFASLLTIGQHDNLGHLRARNPRQVQYAVLDIGSRQLIEQLFGQCGEVAASAARLVIEPLRVGLVVGDGPDTQVVVRLAHQAADGVAGGSEGLEDGRAAHLVQIERVGIEFHFVGLGTGHRLEQDGSLGVVALDSNVTRGCKHAVVGAVDFPVVTVLTACHQQDQSTGTYHLIYIIQFHRFLLFGG